MLDLHRLKIGLAVYRGMVLATACGLTRLLNGSGDLAIGAIRLLVLDPKSS